MFLKPYIHLGIAVTAFVLCSAALALHLVYLEAPFSIFAIGILLYLVGSYCWTIVALCRLTLARIPNLFRRSRPVLMKLFLFQFLGVAFSVACILCLDYAQSGYAKDRLRDGADIFTAAVGKGIGFKARVGPVQTGLLIVQDIAGLRGGRLCKYDRYNGGRDLCIVLAGAEDFNAGGRAMQPRPKEFGSFYCLAPVPVHSKDGPIYTVSYWTQIEFVFGIGGTIRLGFNPGELLDFLLGWVGIDIYGDDIGNKNPPK
jgi:hypothetical protein